MIALTNDQVKIHKDLVPIWMQLNGFWKVRNQWISKSRVVLVTPLLNYKVLIQVGVPA